MNRKLILALLLFTVFAWATPYAAAQRQEKRADRTEWTKQMRRYRAEFVADKIELTAEQREKFIPLYEEMDAKTSKIEHEARAMERDVRKKGTAATDTEYEKTAEALAELKAKQGAVEKEYFDKYRKILTPKQLFKLNNAEREFMRQLMDRHKAGAKKR